MLQCTSSVAGDQLAIQRLTKNLSKMSSKFLRLRLLFKQSVQGSRTTLKVGVIVQHKSTRKKFEVPPNFSLCTPCVPSVSGY